MFIKTSNIFGYTVTDIHLFTTLQLKKKNTLKEFEKKLFEIRGS